MLRVAAIACALFALAGCSHASGGRVSMDASIASFSAPATSLDDVAADGRRAISTYLAVGESTRRRRTNINLGIWAANTFVATAAGLEAHPDSIFAGSMVGTALFGLDPIVNAGNTAAWSQAYSRTACILGFVDLANTDEVKRDVGIVRAVGTPETASAWSQYRGLITFAKSELIATYGDYLVARTPALITPVERPRSEPPAAAQALPGTDQEVSAAAVRLTAIVAASRAGITQCRPTPPQ